MPTRMILMLGVQREVQLSDVEIAMGTRHTKNDVEEGKEKWHVPDFYADYPPRHTLLI